MKKIFVQFGSGLGPMSRTLPIVEALVKEGYIIKYFGYENAKPHMKKIGVAELSEEFHIRDIQKGQQNPDWSCAEEFWEIIGYGHMDWVEKKVEELMGYIKDFSPDYIFSDLAILSCIASRIMNIPLIAINQSCYHPNVAFGRLRWWEEPREMKLKLTENLNNYFKKKGAPLLKCFEELFTGALTLVPSFPEFDPIDNITQYNTHYIGPVLWNPLEEARTEIKALFDRKAGKPTIFCYTARFYDNVGESGIKIFKAIIYALRDFDANIIISTGSELDKKIALEVLKEYNYRSNHFNLIDWIPMGVAYGGSDIVIHHGGHGSCLGQFLYGVPSLIMPTHAEREYNARMCTRLEVAEFLKTVDLCEDSILSEIEKILTMGHYRKNLLVWNKKIKDGYGNLTEVVKLIAKI